MTSEKPEPPDLSQTDAVAVQSSGQALVDALANSPLRDVDFEPESYYPPTRDAVLDTEDFFEDRAKRGKRDAFLRFPDEAGDEPPIEGDRRDESGATG